MATMTASENSSGHPARAARRPSGRMRPRGFSLIEMAVVLFIISLVLRGSLRGHELIGAAQADSLAEDYLNIAQMINSYQDKYRSLPGDDGKAAAHLGAGALAGNGDGRIDGVWNDGGVSSESARAWQHLRLGGLLTGSASDAPGHPPLNALGQPFGLQSGTPDVAKTPIRNAGGTPLAGAYIVCSRAVPGNLVQALDIKLDDGNPATGRMLATLDTGTAYAPGAAPATLGTGRSTDVQPGSYYIVCMGV